jgi:hypothetical protein
LDEIRAELQKQVVDKAETDERMTTREKIIRARETIRQMENQKMTEEVFQKAFNEVLNS